MGNAMAARWDLSMCFGLLGLIASGCSGGQPAVLRPDAQTSSSASAADAAYALASVTSYGAANAILTTGHSDTELGPDHFEVRAKGSGATPPGRLEKIAHARAAEIGVEQKRKFFKLGPAVHSVICHEARDQAHKAGRVAAERAPVVVVDVVYAKDALDPTYLPSAETFERLSGELSQDTIPADAKVAALRAVQAQCGK